MALGNIRSGLTPSVGTRCCGCWPRLAASQRVAGRLMSMTASSVRREYAQTDAFDQKNLIRQKGDVKPQHSARSSDQDVSVIFQPYKIGTYQLPHRMVHAPLTRCRAIDSTPQDNMTEYYRQRGVGSEGGLIISEATVISDTGYGGSAEFMHYTPEDQLAYLHIKNETKSGKSHSEQKQAVVHSVMIEKDFQPNKAPSLSSVAVAADGQIYTPEGPKPHDKPQALDKASISKVVDDFRQAARNAMDAGFDGIELHAANGYLIDQFIKPKPDDRTDEYGGSVENRCWFCLEVVKAVTDEIGSERVAIRLSPYGEFGDVADDNPNATNRYLTEQLNSFGLAYLHMIEPRMAGETEVEVTSSTQNLNHFRKLYNGTFMAAGGYDRERTIESLQKNHADLICFGRIYLSNPDLPRRFREHAELNMYNRDTFYTHDDKGYTDYPFLEGVSKQDDPKL